MAKSRNNLLGVGGQRKKLSRADQHGAGHGRTAAQRADDDRKQALLKKMRERARGAGSTDDTGTAASAPGTDDTGTAADATATGTGTGQE
ncbi:DUF6243 family protein [Streptomyces sp. NPDC002057]|uniref:DUF6243 family protein n=1 Tax=Streptomyces sp. NPDC002057 TaxID=3154664 RepID=UPI00331F9A2B